MSSQMQSSAATKPNALDVLLQANAALSATNTAPAAAAAHPESKIVADGVERKEADTASDAKTNEVYCSRLKLLGFRPLEALQQLSQLHPWEVAFWLLRRPECFVSGAGGKPAYLDSVAHHTWMADYAAAWPQSPKYPVDSIINTGAQLGALLRQLGWACRVYVFSSDASASTSDCARVLQLHYSADSTQLYAICPSQLVGQWSRIVAVDAETRTARHRPFEIKGQLSLHTSDEMYKVKSTALTNSSEFIGRPVSLDDVDALMASVPMGALNGMPEVWKEICVLVPLLHKTSVVDLDGTISGRVKVVYGALMNHLSSGLDVGNFRYCSDSITRAQILALFHRKVSSILNKFATP